MVEEKEIIKQVYTAVEIQTILGLSKNKTYAYLEDISINKGPFRVIKIGKLYRIPKKEFDEWFNKNS